MINRHNKLQSILNQIREIVNSQDTDVVFSKYENAEQLLQDIDKLNHRLEHNDQSVFKDICYFFAPTGSLQDISITNGWGEKFIELSKLVDEIVNMK